MPVPSAANASSASSPISATPRRSVRRRARTEDAVFDYVYLRDNIAGDMQEYWYHGGGCRAWLKVGRNTLTHEIKSVEPAAGAGAAKVGG